MFRNKKVLAVIPARGGSKGVLRKNIRDMAGKPLIAWTIEEARKSIYIDRLILTSEDEEIIAIAEEYGCDVPFVRPKELALDQTPGIDPVLHAIETVKGFDIVVLLQPTSPLRSVEDIDGTIEKLSDSPACVSVSSPEKSPFWMYKLNAAGELRQLIKQDSLVVRRQDLPQVYCLNGAVYAAETDWLRKTKSFLTEQAVGYVMPSDRAYDIDTINDFLFCEFLMRRMIDGEA